MLNMTRIPGLAQVTNAFDPSMSPPGTDLWWFWTGLTPSYPEEGWEVARKKITDSIIKDADEYYKGVESMQVAIRPLVLPDIEERFWAIDGSVYYVDPTISRFGPNKPVIGFSGYRTPVDGLFLTGSGNPSGRRHQRHARAKRRAHHAQAVPPRGHRRAVGGVAGAAQTRQRRGERPVFEQPERSGPRRNLTSRRASRSRAENAGAGSSFAASNLAQIRADSGSSSPSAC